MSLTRRQLLRTAASGLLAFAAARSARPRETRDAALGAAAPRENVRLAVERYLSQAQADDRGPRLAVVYFHWFAVSDGKQIGQVPGPALPADAYIRERGDRSRLRPGMLAWNGSVAQHRRHDLALLGAGFDTFVFQLPKDYHRSVSNHTASLRQLEQEGHAIPKVVPFIEAASYRKYHQERDFHDERVRQHLFDRYAGFFDQHFAALGPENLVWKDGRVFVHQWWIPGIEKAPASLLDELGERCFERYGFRLFFSTHEYLAHLSPDRLDRLFNGVQPWRRDRDGNYSLLPGFFPPSQDAVDNGYFVPRRHGETYQGAWNAIEEDVAARGSVPEWIVVESANEIAECTSILPLVELPRRVLTEQRTPELCTSRACVAPGAKHYPVEIGEPMFYLDATRKSWRRFRERFGVA